MKCDVCKSTIRKSFGVYKNNLKAGRLKVSQANLAMCPGCEDILNLCPKHGWFSSEWSQMYLGRGDICPKCYQDKEKT
jgi:hypothetical protein